MGQRFFKTKIDIYYRFCIWENTKKKWNVRTDQ